MCALVAIGGPKKRIRPRSRLKSAIMDMSPVEVLTTMGALGQTDISPFPAFDDWDAEFNKQMLKSYEAAKAIDPDAFKVEPRPKDDPETRRLGVHSPWSYYLVHDSMTYDYSDSEMM